MITKLFNHPRVLWQTADEADEVPNYPVTACVDNGGTIVLGQEDQSIVLNRASVPELCKLLKQLMSETDVL